MNLDQFAVGEIIGVHATNGDQFFQVMKGGLDGPYLDRECTIPWMDPGLKQEVTANALKQKHYGTGKRRRNKELTMSDGVQYKTDGNGVLHRQTPKISKKERRRVKQPEPEPREMSYEDRRKWFESQNVKPTQSE